MIVWSLTQPVLFFSLSFLGQYKRLTVNMTTKGEELQLSDVWQHLVRGSDVQHHGAQLIANLNQTELLEAIVARHSVVKSTAYGLGAVAGACGAVGSGCKAYVAYTVATGPWGWFAVAVICVSVAAVSAYKTSEHNEYRNRCEKGKTRTQPQRRLLDPHPRQLTIHTTHISNHHFFSFLFFCDIENYIANSHTFLQSEYT